MVLLGKRDNRIREQRGIGHLDGRLDAAVMGRLLLEEENLKGLIKQRSVP